MSPRRVLLPTALTALLAAPATAQAKEVAAIRACDQDGTCHTIRVDSQDGMGLLPAGRGGGPPDHRAPFHRLTLVMEAGDGQTARLHVLYAPSLRLVAFDEPGADLVWETPPAAALRLAARAVQGLAPRPAARMPLEQPAAATFAPPDPTATAAPPVRAEAEQGTPWAALGAGALAALLAAVAGVKAWRRPRAA
jgi:hypothetical protein